MQHTTSLPPPVWVAHTAVLQEMLAHLRLEPALAVDTESNSLYVYHERVCLVQISVPGTDYLIDPLALPDLSGLRPLLANPAVLKVMHGAEYDLAVLHRDLDCVVANLFDTMWASRILGWPAHGLAALLEAHFGVVLDKRYQRADWGVRPLPPAQLDYARLDTHYLLRLADMQRGELVAAQRWPQAQDRFARLVETRWDHKGFDPDGFWALPSVRDLDDAGRGVLRELYLFRDQQARAMDRPCFKVLSDRALVALAQQLPADLRSLGKVPGLTPKLVNRFGTGVLAAVRRGQAQPLPWDRRPRPPRRDGRSPGDRPAPASQARFELLRAWRNQAAAAKGVEPDIILNNHTLWAVAERNPRRLSDLSADGLLARWQVDEFGADLIAVLKR